MNRDYEWVVAALGKIGGNEAGETILKLLQETRQYMSHGAAKALQQCGYKVRKTDDDEYEYLAHNGTTWHKL